MHLRITQILSQQTPQMVEFATEFGTGRGLWMSGDVLVESAYHVEVEFVDTLIWGENLSIASTDEFALITSGDSTSFHAKIEQVEDMIYTIQFGSSGFMVEIDQHPVDAGYSVWLKVKSDRLLLYDTNV